MSRPLFNILFQIKPIQYPISSTLILILQICLCLGAVISVTTYDLDVSLFLASTISMYVTALFSVIAATCIELNSCLIVHTVSAHKNTVRCFKITMRLNWAAQIYITPPISSNNSRTPQHYFSGIVISVTSNLRRGLGGSRKIYKPPGRKSGII
jgi:hypothetical protein